MSDNHFVPESTHKSCGVVQPVPPVVFQTQVIGKVFERILASELKVSTFDCQFRSRWSRYIRDSGWVFLGMHGTVDG